MGQIRSRIDLNRLGRLAVAAIEEGLRGRNASRRRGFRVLHDCEQGVDRVLCALAGGIRDVAEYPSRLDRGGALLVVPSDCRSGQDESSLSAAHRVTFCLPLPVRLSVLASDRPVLKGEAGASAASIAPGGWRAPVELRRAPCFFGSGLF